MAGITFYKLATGSSGNGTGTIQLGDSDVYLVEDICNSPMDGHYFTSTGLVFDNNTGNTYIRISSWGKWLESTCFLQ